MAPSPCPAAPMRSPSGSRTRAYMSSCRTVSVNRHRSPSWPTMPAWSARSDVGIRHLPQLHALGPLKVALRPTSAFDRTLQAILVVSHGSRGRLADRYERVGWPQTELGG